MYGPGSGSPLKSEKRDARRPSRAAVAFILATKAVRPGP